MLKIEGAFSFGTTFPSQGECQNVAVFPFLMDTFMEA
jgi:hypothetical protein